MTRKNAGRLVSISIVFCVAALGAALYFWRQASLYQRYLEYTNDRAFSNLVTSVSNLDSALQKGVYADSPSMLSTLSAQIWRESTNAKSSLAQMTLNDINLDKTQKFISQAGEYAYTILRKSSAGAPLSKEERKTLTVLSDTADRLSTSLQEVKSKYNDGTIKLSIKKTGTTTSASAKEASPKSSAFEDLEGDFPNYATLIYDGPYSEHIEKKEPVFLKGKTEVTEQEARKKAALFMKTDEGKLKSAGTGDGKIKTYMFSMQKGNGNISIEVTKFGGYILQAIDSQDGGEKTISAEEGVKKAAAILNSIGFPDMKESYYTENDGILTVNYAATENSVICYPDLIKVAVSLHDGSLRSLDTYGYLMNHRKRNPGEPSVPAGIASKKVNGGLKILSSSLAVIPTSGKNETFCHEFKCENGKGKHFIVYVNAKTGIEENILILIEDENGTLTI